jgi:hypothetical protein
MFKLGWMVAYLGRGALKPLIVAKEFDTAPGLGQADGGDNAGTYLELGVAPGWAAEQASLAFPVKVGMSLSDYRAGRRDSKFGYLAWWHRHRAAQRTRAGAWNIHGGVEFQATRRR